MVAAGCGGEREAAGSSAVGGALPPATLLAKVEAAAATDREGGRSAAPESEVETTVDDPGSFTRHLRIESSFDGLTLSARGVLRSTVLRQLAERYRFDLLEWDDRDPRLDLELDEVTLETGVARILEETPYALRYDRERYTGKTRLVALEVGLRREAREPQEGQDEPDRARRQDESGEVDETYASQRTRQHGSPGSEAARRAALERRAERQADRRRQRLDWFESEDPALRERAAFLADADSAEERAMLAGLLREDPSPIVRAEAARKLGFGEGEDQVDTLVSSLDDSDPAVLVQVLSALGWLQDPRLAGSIEPLLQHPDGDVRTAAELATVYLTQGAYTLARPRGGAVP